MIKFDKLTKLSDGQMSYLKEMIFNFSLLNDINIPTLNLFGLYFYTGEIKNFKNLLSSRKFFNYCHDKNPVADKLATWRIKDKFSGSLSTDSSLKAGFSCCRLRYEELF